MAQELIVYIFIAGLVTGVIGWVLGSFIDKSEAGFWLGAFLGPLGWIIVLLLPRDSEYKKDSHSQSAPQCNIPAPPPKDTDLSSDSYRLYLGKKYDIQRNDLFQQFECKEKLFESLDEAMVFADELEREERGEQERSIVEARKEGLGRNLSWHTIRDNLQRENIIVDRSAPLFGSPVYSAIEDNKRLEFFTLEELQDYYMSKV